MTVEASKQLQNKQVIKSKPSKPSLAESQSSLLRAKYATAKPVQSSHEHSSKKPTSSTTRIVEKPINFGQLLQQPLFSTQKSG